MGKTPGGVFGRGFVRSIAAIWIERRKSLPNTIWPRRITAPAPKSQRANSLNAEWIPALAVVVLIGMLVGIVIGGDTHGGGMRTRAAKASAVWPLPPARNMESRNFQSRPRQQQVRVLADVRCFTGGASCRSNCNFQRTTNLKLPARLFGVLLRLTVS